MKTQPPLAAAACLAVAATAKAEATAVALRMRGNCLSYTIREGGGTEWTRILTANHAKYANLATPCGVVCFARQRIECGLYGMGGQV